MKTTETIVPYKLQITGKTTWMYDFLRAVKMKLKKPRAVFELELPIPLRMTITFRSLYLLKIYDII